MASPDLHGMCHSVPQHYDVWGQKMKLFHVIEGIMVRLGELPGLSFLATFVSEHQEEALRRKNTFVKYKSYVQSLRGAAEEAGHLGHGHDRDGGPGDNHGHGPKKHSHAKQERIEDDMDDVDEEYNEEDDDFESYLL